jgi:CBS domain-containing protein
MSEHGPDGAKLGRDDARGLLVRDVMVRHPKTLPAGCSVAELRALFANPRVRTALLTEGGRFAGAIDPEELPEGTDGSEPAQAYARADVRAVRPDAPMAEALELMERDGDHRLIVLGDDGRTLAGLLCLDRQGDAFCVEAPAEQA